MKILKLISVTFVFVILKCPEEMQCLMSWILNLNAVWSNKKLQLFLDFFFSLSIFILHLKVSSRSLIPELPFQLPCCSWWLGHIPVLFACYKCGEYPSDDNCLLCVWTPATMWVFELVFFSVFFKKTKLTLPHFH